jgi:hypothetical protein
MRLIQILLPLYDNDGRAFPGKMFQKVQEELVARFGGVTAYTRTPAEGKWCEAGAEVRDEIVICEVMAESLEKDWWENYRVQLEHRFAQDAIVVRALPIEML